MNLKGTHILSAKQFDRDHLEYIMDKAMEIENNKEKFSEALRGRIMATLFFEPSTRTRLSFESAMMRLGGSVIGFSSAEVSSVKKGETLADTIRTVSNYADVIVIRHNMEGAAKLAARFSDVPVINAGSGPGEHPTQALLDLLCIREECGRIDGLNIGLIGDLRYGRTVHSLAYLLANYDVNLYFISPPALRMQYRVLDYLRRKSVKFKETHRFKNTLPLLDVIYMTRIQKERFPDIEEYNAVKDVYILSGSDLKNLKEKAIIMHPLPRVNEITPDVDKSPHAVYFKETYYGLMMRKALLYLILGDY